MEPVGDDHLVECREYFVHLKPKRKKESAPKKEAVPFYECKTYDAHGTLIKTELRPPRYEVSRYQEGFYGRHFYGRSGSDYNSDGPRDPKGS